MSSWRLLLTRPANECATQVPELAAAGVAAQPFPLLALEPSVETAIERSLLLELARYSLVIVVSKTAARLMLERVDRYWPQPPHAQLWACVGPGTAQILHDYGLDTASPEAGRDSEALWALPAVQHALQRPDARVLIVRGEGGRDWLTQQLDSQGIAWDSLALYRRVCPSVGSAELLSHLAAGAINGIVLSSAAGLDNLQHIAGEHWSQVLRLPLLVPSARVAEQARALGAPHVVVLRGLRSDELIASLPPAPPPGVISFT
ncbi:uroporphyrinogen-III synthase [Atopomonas sediminilitoris]|uniref:uroporphyrinogen-III synthase n=1 Tax=Atopomonas sediminilitoris TaxID=2919919 RepID=UPI001F4E1E7E|nr:uroporphyrinogen-III synthase [Atopomonas sediminilitoris]MCJ8170514.1 uroporphyrinogen-III synthase [Atopomonas sediminilitoris]